MRSAEIDPESRDPSSTLATSKTPEAERIAPKAAASSASVASSKRRGEQRSEPVQKAKQEPESEPVPEPAPPPVPDVDAKPDEAAVDDPVPAPPHGQPHDEHSPERSPLPVPMPLPVLHPSIFSEEGLLTYAMNAIHPDPPPELSTHVEQHDTYADFYSKDPRRRKTPLLHVKPLPNNQPLPKLEREYHSYADFYANDPRLMRHVDDRPLPTLVKKEAAKREAAKAAERSSRHQSTSKPSKPKLTIPSKAPADPPRLAETKHRPRSRSRHRHRHHHRSKSRSSFEDFAISSNLSGSGRLTTPGASVGPSRSRSRSREKRHGHHRKSGQKSRRHSPATRDAAITRTRSKADAGDSAQALLDAVPHTRWCRIRLFQRKPFACRVASADPRHASRLEWPANPDVDVDDGIRRRWG
ncbi:hypothetical protein F5148DRAFT_162085 [Russula earlei]|uniref:Uncharacterized protein n=1 Tax=Russula earlei TaxID=71964 RepID=A0ACC0U6F9_9AGAM|nr:hypothetical protein F5148DRAFT_162085 [Russula earlei]